MKKSSSFSGSLGFVLAAAGSNRDEIGALRFKLRNTPASQLVTRSKFASNMKAEAEYWINHESERIAILLKISDLYLSH